MYSITSLSGANWKLKDFDERQSLMISQRHNISPLISKLLNIRNIPDHKIDQFLNPEILNFLPDPFKIIDMSKSVERVIETILNKKLIGIIADYDVDGSTSAAIICKFFKYINQKYILNNGNIVLIITTLLIELKKIIESEYYNIHELEEWLNYPN